MPDHFPADADVFAACQGHFLAQHPQPDLTEALAPDDPSERVRAVLRALSVTHRDLEQMTAKVLRDRAALPALDELLERTIDAQQAGLAEILAPDSGSAGRPPGGCAGWSRWRSTSGPGSGSSAPGSTTRRPPT